MKTSTLAFSALLALNLFTIPVIAQQNTSLVEAPGPNVGGGTFKNRQHYMRALKVAADMIYMVENNPEKIAEEIKSYGGKVDLERFKGSLRNILSMPLKPVIGKNISGAPEEKILDYDPTSNSIILLKPYFDQFEYLNKLQQGNNITTSSTLSPLMIEIFAQEASHSQGLGLNAETDLAESLDFARWFKENSNQLNTGNFRCGKSGTKEERQKHCAWTYEKFSKILLPIGNRKDTILSHWTEQFKIEYRYVIKRYLNVGYLLENSISKTIYAYVEHSLTKKPTLKDLEEACEKIKKDLNLNQAVRPATTNEAQQLVRFRYENDGKESDFHIQTADAGEIVSSITGQAIPEHKFFEPGGLFSHSKTIPQYMARICIVE